jgi:hypothetical protein
MEPGSNAFEGLAFKPFIWHTDCIYTYEQLFYIIYALHFYEGLFFDIIILGFISVLLPYPPAVMGEEAL